MKKWILTFSLLSTFSAFASYEQDQLTPISEGEVILKCSENEVPTEVIVGRYCVVRDPITYSCMFWENLYKEICQPK